MLDQYGRDIRYMRISITDRCNLRCRYCMPQEEQHEETLLDAEEILRLCACAVSLGITRFKITGGEPLVRADCPELIRRLKEIPGVEQVTLTTNGLCLSQALPSLARAKIDGINVSLDTLRPERFREITGRDGWQRVWDGIQEGVRLGIPMKVNCVLLGGINEDEILNFVRLARKEPLDVRFIEMMPIGPGKGWAGVGSERVFETVRREYPDFAPVSETRGNGPAVYGRIPGFLGCIGWIDAVHGKFCQTCNRVRLTGDGFLKPCLYYASGTDLRALLRRGASDEELAGAMEQAVRHKPREHHFGEKSRDGEAEERNMSQIGG